jgi:radical SAM superfamily enzyme YgiQ (UPF0313 family)
MKRQAHSWSEIRRAERPLGSYSAHGRHALAVAWPNSYHLGMSSLALQRLYALVHATPEWTAHRFFADGEGMPRSVEDDSPLDEFGAIAFSISFEEDYVGFLRVLDRAAVPLRRLERTAHDPLVIVGGACAMINPLPLSEFVDVFALGAAENLLPPLLGALGEEHEKEAALERLAVCDGFFVPSRHDPDSAARSGKLKKLELSEAQMRVPGHLPTTAIVTPHTEFASKFLIEMSRGCPEKCRYCWATFGMGRFRWHPTEFILDAVHSARAVTDQLGFVATAVGDHPDIERILTTASDLGFRSAVSSIRIPAVTEGVLAALYASGDRSITLAPETGSDELRRRLNKPISNELLLEKVRLVFRHGFTQLKLYFLIGLPHESMEDVEAIVDLVAECRQLMLAELAPRGVIGNIHVGANILVPKPYTGWQREAMESPAELGPKIARLRRAIGQLPNTSLGAVSIRQAVWQTFLSKAGPGAADVLERAARGAPLARLLRAHRELIEPLVFERAPAGERLRWHFLRAG